MGSSVQLVSASSSYLDLYWQICIYSTQARAEPKPAVTGGFGLAWNFCKPKPSEARPKLQLSSQARPEHHEDSSPLCLIYWPTCLHCTLSIVGLLVSIVLHIPAHPSPSHTAIHNLLYSTSLYYHLYYIPWAHPVALDTHHPPAHSSIMVQLLPWAHIGWPVSIGTLSPSAAHLRWVNSLNGLTKHWICINRTLQQHRKKV
jgi:hypothetical protein